MENYQIFISYRRDGGDALAGRLADRFTALGYKVFYDVESMRSGMFNTQILDAISQCNDVFLVLPPNALDRCVNEDDWVRQELAFALKQNKNIIPVMMRGFVFPEKLPQDIENVKIMEGVTASSEYFDAVISKLELLLVSKKRTDNTLRPSVSTIGKFEELLQELYELLVKYRDALRRGENALFHETTSKLQSILQELHVISERYQYSQKETAAKAASIVNQFNKYVVPFNAFANATDRMSDEAQGFAMQAEHEFQELINMVVNMLP